MKRKAILILLIGVMLSLLLPPNAAAVDGLVVGSTVELSYEEKYVGTDGKTYHGGDVRNASVGNFQSICVEWGIEYKGGTYTVSDAKADPVILRAIYYYEQIKNNASYPDAYAALQFVIWDPVGSWAPGDVYSVKGRPAEAAYHYILQGVKSGTPSDAELNAYYDGKYCLLDSPVAGQQQFVWANQIPFSAKGSITIHKVDANGSPLAGAVFTITSDNDPFFSMDIETDANGYATTGTDALDFGYYRIIETRPPDGYPDTRWQRNVTIDSDNQDFTVTVVNRKQGSIGIQKVDQYGNPVPGVVLEIGVSWTDNADPESGEHDYELEEVFATVTTDENGYAVISYYDDGSPIEEGTYYVLEKSAPEGYMLDPNIEPYAVTLVGNTTTWITIENERSNTEVTVTKKWKDSNNAWGLRPDSVTLRLLANGVEVAHAEVSGSATADSWSYTFTDLPIEDGGVPITYTVTEDPVRNYSTKIDGLTVTNEYVPIVPTGIALDIAPYAVLLMMGTLGAAALMKKKDR